MTITVPFSVACAGDYEAVVEVWQISREPGQPHKLASAQRIGNGGLGTATLFDGQYVVLREAKRERPPEPEIEVSP